jgi:putative ABC transport system permease protein
MAPGSPFEFTFLDQEIDTLYKAEMRMEKLIRFGTYLGIFIACLGLVGLASFMAEQRTKEIGIRKILGSTRQQIVFIFSREFTIWIAAANLAAWPAAAFILNKWLQSFAYRIHLTVPTFILAGGSVLVLALLTISAQAVKAASADPIKSLRYE